MVVTKRDGEKEPISLDKITNRVSVLSTGLNIDPIVVVQKAVPGLYNEITSTEIDTYLAFANVCSMLLAVACFCSLCVPLL